MLGSERGCILALPAIKGVAFVAAGGLGEYGSDESDGGHSTKASDSSDTDEEELRHRIRQKQDAFRRQERALQQQEERRATEGPLAPGASLQNLYR